MFGRYRSNHFCFSSKEQEFIVAECNAYAQRNGYTIVGEYIDRAISGTTDAQPNFLKMIDDA